MEAQGLSETTKDFSINGVNVSVVDKVRCLVEITWALGETEVLNMLSGPPERGVQRFLNQWRRVCPGRREVLALSVTAITL
eukprot:1157893-Pelagomonas_calceolata.AAC.1